MFDKSRVGKRITNFEMEVNNRQLLRRYKELREKLVSGEVDEIRIPQKNGAILKIVVERKGETLGDLLKEIRKNPIKGLKRPEEDIF